MKLVHPFLALLALGFAGTTTMAQQQGTTGLFVAGDCVIPVPDGEVQGETFLCGTVQVPEFHDDPNNGNPIELAVAIVKKVTGGTALDPLVMFNGGPGSSIFGLTNGMLNSPVRKDRDIVLFSERGTFGAVPFLICPEIEESMEGHFGESFAKINELQLDGFAKCRDRLISEGVNLNAYNNPERAKDVPVVMEALGYSDYNLWGVSGGGIYAQYVLREFPQGAGIRTIMTDSGAFPNTSFSEVWLTLLDNASNSYRLLFADCEANTECKQNYPDLENVFFQFIDDLNANPMPLEIIHPVTGEQAEFALTGDVVVAMLTNSFSAVAMLPQVIYAMAQNNDFSVMQSLVPSTFVGAGSDFGDALFQSVACTEIGGITVDDVSTANAYPQIIQAMLPKIQHTLDICKFWNVDPVPQGDVLVSDDVPILIMEGLYDANKPPELGAIVAEHFATSHLVEFPAKAHVVLGGCAQQIMADFMNDPEATPDTSCVEQEVNFIVDGVEVTFSEVSLEEIGITTLLVPDGWQPVEGQVGVYVKGEKVLVIASVPMNDEVDAVQAFADGFGISTFDRINEEDINGHTWGIYQNIDGNTGRLLAATVHGEQTYIVGIDTTLTTLSDDAETIQRPVVESIAFHDEAGTEPPSLPTTSGAVLLGVGHGGGSGVDVGLMIWTVFAGCGWFLI